MSKDSLTRRTFLIGAAGLAAAGCATARRTSSIRVRRPISPNEKVNIASIGCGGQGGGDISAFGNLCNVVALCDVDVGRAGGARERFPDAPFYQDYREMLDREHRNIDAVQISTPDHTHAVAAMACMELGKHVFVQKPLTHNIREARELTYAARRHKVATHMGNQGHQGVGVRRISEWVAANRIGPIREVHCWTDRPWWPQDVGRPEETPPVPDNVDWDAWLGPAPYRPYSPAYHPFSWRGWWDFGSGALGDMGCHIMDPAYTSLNLGYPTAVEADFEGGTDETLPAASTITFEFPARGDMPPVKLYWYDGGRKPERPEDIPEDEQLGDGGNGSLFVGDWGYITCDTYGGSPRLVPYEKPRVEKTIPNSIGHYEEFVEAVKTGKPAGGNFDYAGPFTETILLGVLVMRVGKRIEWDGPGMRVTNNVPEAEQWIGRTYRRGWSL
jgi:predicted dehydrogenase